MPLEPVEGGEAEIRRKGLGAEAGKEGDFPVVAPFHHPDAAEAPGVVEVEGSLLHEEAGPGVGGCLQAEAPGHPQVEDHLQAPGKGQEEELPPPPYLLHPSPFRPFRVAVAGGVLVDYLEEGLAQDQRPKPPTGGLHLRKLGHGASFGPGSGRAPRRSQRG